MSNGTGIKVARLAHVGLRAQDLSQQADFYTARWGLDPIEEAPGNVFLRGEGPDHHVLALHESADAGLDHFAFEVAHPDDIERAAEILAAQGTEIVTPPTQDLEPGVNKAIRFKDPDGNVVELIAGVDQVRDAYGPRDVKPQLLNHVVLNTRDRPRLEQFYGRTLGFKLSDTLADFMTFWRCNANHHSLAFATAPGGRLGLNHAAFEVKDWQDLMRGVFFLGEHGVRRMWGPGRHLAGNNLFSYYFDPEGNVVEYTTEVEQITNDDYVPPLRPMIADQWGSSPPGGALMSASHHDAVALAPPRVEEVSAGIYAYIQPDGSWFLNNAGFLVGRNGVVSVDTTSTERRTRDYLTAIRRVSDKPIRTLINTHHHGDHTHGNCLLPEATIVGHPLCREEILRSAVPPPAGLWSTVDWGDLWPVPPFVTFEGTLTVWIDELRVELHCVPTPAHTTNDVVAWIPERSVLFTGDLVFVGGTPFVPMGSVSGSLAALRWLHGFGAQTLVPGHGPVSDASVLDDVRDYLQFVQDTAERGKAAGLNPLELARETDLGRFAGLTDAERIVGNLHRAYAELDGAEPGAPIDTAVALREMVAYNNGQPLTCLA